MSNSHDQAPATPVELTDSEKNLLAIDQVNAWRAHQYAQLSKARSEARFAPDGTYIGDFEQSIDTTLDDFLERNGVDSSSAHYTEIREVYRNASIDKITSDEWGNSPAVRGIDANDHETTEHKFARRIESVLSAYTVGEPEDEPEEDTVDDNEEDDFDFDRLQTEALVMNQEFDDAHTALEEARSEWAKASAARGSKLFGRKDDNHEAIEAKYQAALQARGKIALQNELADADLSDEEKNVAVVTYLFDEQEQLREQITDNLNNTKVGRFVRFMNSGSKTVRIGKGIGVGIVAGVAGSFLAGAAGAGIVAAGTVAAARFARGYAQHDTRGVLTTEAHIDRGVVAEVMTEERGTLADADRADRFDDANRHFSYLLEDQTIDQQKKRRKAFAWGAGSVALGATIGWGLHAASEWSSGKNLTLVSEESWSDFKDWINDEPDVNVNLPDDAPDDVDVADDTHDVDRDNDGVDNRFDATPDGTIDTDLDRDGDGVRNWMDANPDNADISDVADGRLELSDAAVNVVPGEGGFQTLTEMGVPVSKHEAIWEQIGEQLGDKVYRMDDGRWGWSYPMHLSNHDIRIFESVTAKNGIEL